ncbi:MAG: hypothetical protein AB4352_17585 [Hormoscilla sp.]
MNIPLLNQMSEWNAQFFREIKGRMKTRSVMIAVLASLVGQAMLMMVCSQSKCLRYAADKSCAAYEWQFQWSDAFTFLDWCLPFILLVCGVYLLIGDMAKERRRGTMNFIRLSPQSSQNIFLGKLLGVPVLVYLGVALGIPLHLVSGLGSGRSLIGILAIYSLWAAGCCLFYTTALLVNFLSNPEWGEQSQAGGGGFLASMLAMPYISLLYGSWDFYSSTYTPDWEWFFLPIGSVPIFAYGLAMVTLGMASYWIWQALNRRYQNPNSTLLSKQQSYWLTASFQILLLGFFWPEISDNTTVLQGQLFFVSIVNLFAFLALIMALSPHRQACLDWARYRHQQESHRSLLQDLIWGEKSPAVLAIAVNLAITTAIWMPWVLRWPEGEEKIAAVGGMLICANLISIYGAIAQLVLLSKLPKRGSLATSTVFASLLLPLVVVVQEKTTPMFLMFAIFGSAFWAIGEASAIGIFMAILGQWSILGLLNFQLTRQLRKFGESHSQALLAGS